MAGLVDAAMDHDGPGDPRGLIGDRDRRLFFRHTAEQLRDPGKDGLDKLAEDRGVPYSDVAHAALVAYLKRHGIREPR